jgi:hypothetical protein
MFAFFEANQCNGDFSSTALGQFSKVIFSKEIRSSPCETPAPKSSDVVASSRLCEGGTVIGHEEAESRSRPPQIAPGRRIDLALIAAVRASVRSCEPSHA